MNIKIYRIARIALLLCVALKCGAQENSSQGSEPPSPIVLWPNGAPGEKGNIGPEAEVERKETRKATRITNITSPTLTIFRPPADKDTGTLVIVCPGGGYNYVVADKEGTEIIEWLNTLGVSGALLKYRVPTRKDRPRHLAPLQDAQRAISVLRHRATDLGIKPDQIGIMGFSAGGHVAACTSTNSEKRAYSPVDAIDETSCRPDFAVLMYPAYLTQKDNGDKLSPEVPVSEKTPPTFIAMTQDDGVRVESAIFYYLALKNAKVPAEMHLFPTGGHGYGLRIEGHNVATWPKRAEDWLRNQGLLKPAR